MVFFCENRELFRIQIIFCRCLKFQKSLRTLNNSVDFETPGMRFYKKKVDKNDKFKVNYLTNSFI